MGNLPAFTIASLSTCSGFAVPLSWQPSMVLLEYAGFQKLRDIKTQEYDTKTEKSVAYQIWKFRLPDMLISFREK